MTSTDREGILDKYFYSYNNSGLISGIGRERRDLAAVSGQYEYQYDAIGRLTRSSLNGELRASYEYDAFGNRTSLVEKDAQTTYTYDVLDRLVEAKELNNTQAIVRSYDYDKRGNQTSEYVDGLLNKTFTFDATNMLSKVVDSEKGELENQYNGLGFRVASTRPEEKIEYLCDLSRDYYNLLERTVNGETESFIYDKNVISMSKAENTYYYLQDELGSPMYMTGTDGAAVSSYAFDDFGRGIDPFTGKIEEHRNKHTNGIVEPCDKHAYTKEGNIIQPFAFTGYQEDEVSGLMFAQARHYDASSGRFQSEDRVKGFRNAPYTLNHYGYCFGNPVGFSDKNGKWPGWMEDAWDTACDVASDVKDAASGAWDATCDFCEEHKEMIVATGATVAAVGITVATCGTGAGVAAGILIAGTGGAFAYDAYQNGEDVEKAFARGVTDTSVIIASAAANPVGTMTGMGTQLAVDFLRDDLSSPEAYAAAAVGGAVGDSVPFVGGFAGGIAGSLTNDLLSETVGGEEEQSISKIAYHALKSAALGAIFDIGALGLQNISLGSVGMALESLTNPLWFLKEYNTQSIWSQIDDWGRAFLGVNNGADIISGVMNTYLDCGE